MLRFRTVLVLFTCLVLCCAGGFAQTAASFTTKTVSAGTQPRNLYAVDVNNDGVPDIIEDDLSLPDQFSVMLAKGDGTFAAPKTIYTFGTQYQGVAPMVAGDFNGDGKVDLVFAMAGSNQLAVFLGNGDGTFQAPKFETIALPSGEHFGGAYIVAADFNHDGKLDLVTEANTNSAGAVDLIPGDGNGSFGAPQTIYTPPANSGIGSIGVGDFDGDTNADVAVGVSSDCDQGGCSQQDVYVLYGNGDFGFSTDHVYSASGQLSFSTGDVNSDGRTDIFGIGGAGNNDLVVLTSQPDRQFTTFTMPTGLTLSGTLGTAAPMVLGDFNGDGKMDLATVGFTSSTSVFAVFLANGSGGYEQQTVDIGSTQEMSNPVIGDFSRDTKPDLATVWSSNAVPPTLTVAENTTASGNWGGCAYPAKGQGIELCSPGSTSPGSVVFSAAANSFGPLRKIEVWVDGKKIGEQYHVWENQGWLNLTSSLSNGKHTVTLYAANIDNTLEKITRTFEVGASGCSAPSSAGVNLCSPASGATVSSPVQVEASATVTGKLDQMELWVDGVKKDTQTSSATLNTSISLSAGTHRFAVLAVNTSGQKWEQAVDAKVK
ncbi:MAG: FG-GAP-like repeat-containing protein [Acidobacteriaceae bacterium]